MKCYIKKDDFIDSNEFLEVRKITFSCSSSDLKDIAHFLNDAANIIEQSNSNLKTIELAKSDYKLNSNFDIVIMDDKLF